MENIMNGTKKRMIVFISGGGTNLQALIDACKLGVVNAEIVLVISDRHGAGGLKRAEKENIPQHVIEYRRYVHQAKEMGNDFPLPPDFDLMKTMIGAKDFVSKRWNMKDEAEREKAERFFKARAAAEQEILEIIEPYQSDFICLAGFMQILTPYFQFRYQPDIFNPRIINIHPALLPAFPGENGYEDTYFYGNPIYGCTVHYVDWDEDTGPIIGQGVLIRKPGMTFDKFKEEGLKIEHQLYPLCVQYHIEGKAVIVVNKRRTVENPLAILQANQY